MDNAGYRSGYVYKQPLVKEEPPKPKSDVELPAAVSSLGFLLEEQNLYKDGPLQALLGGFNKSNKEDELAQRVPKGRSSRNRHAGPKKDHKVGTRRISIKIDTYQGGKSKSIRSARHKQKGV